MTEFFLMILFQLDMFQINLRLNNVNDINIGDTNYDEEDPDTIILNILLTSHIKFEKPK